MLRDFSSSEGQTPAGHFLPDSSRAELNCFFSCIIKSCLIDSQYQLEQLFVCFIYGGEIRLLCLSFKTYKIIKVGKDL